jgi:CobQ-like glutamine amidotransferase family enzyme
MMRIELLFPELAVLYGDPMNMNFLLRALPDAQVVRTRHTSRPAFADGDVDMVYLGSMTESAQVLAVRALAPYRAELERFIDEGRVFLATGNASELFGERIEDADGAITPMLGLFPTVARRDMMNRFNGLYWGKLGGRDEVDEIQIVGFKSQFAHSYGECGGLFETFRGGGRNPDVAPEGLRRNNFMATNVLGPLLVLNPPFTKYILGLLGRGDAELPFEKAAMDSYELRLREFSDPKTGFDY